MDERSKIIYRLEKLINNNKEFYERHPELLQQVKDKIQFLKEGYDYKIRNANWVIPYTWGSSVGLQKIDRYGKILLQDVEKIKNEMTLDKAKELCQMTYDDWESLIPTDDCNEEEKKHIEKLNKEVYERIKLLNIRDDVRGR